MSDEELIAWLRKADEYEPLGHDGWEAAARIAALTAQNREMALDVLASSGQAQEAYAAQLAAEAEAAALTAQVAELTRLTNGQEEILETQGNTIIRINNRNEDLTARVARLEGALTDMPKAVLRTTVCQGPVWPDDRPGVWLAALEACAKSVQEAVDAALSEGGKDG